MLALDIIQGETTLAEASRQFDVLLSQIDYCAYPDDAARLKLDQAYVMWLANQLPSGRRAHHQDRHRALQTKKGGSRPPFFPDTMY